MLLQDCVVRIHNVAELTFITYNGLLFTQSGQNIPCTQKRYWCAAGS